MLEALNGLYVQWAYVQHAYLNANPKEKVFFYYVEEFDKDKYKVVIMIRTLYGMQLMGYEFVEAIHQMLRDLGFQPYWAYAAVLMQASANTPAQGMTETETNVRPSLEHVLESLTGTYVPQDKLFVEDQYWGSTKGIPFVENQYCCSTKGFPL